MPNSETLAAFVETATKCFATAFVSPPSAASDQSRALWYDVLAIDDDRCPPWRTQGNVQHSAVLCDVNLVAAEHRVDARAQTALLGQFSEQPHCLFRDAVLRVVKIQTNCLRREPLA